MPLRPLPIFILLLLLLVFLLLLFPSLQGSHFSHLMLLFILANSLPPPLTHQPCILQHSLSLVPLLPPPTTVTHLSSLPLLDHPLCPFTPPSPPREATRRRSPPPLPTSGSFFILTPTHHLSPPSHFTPSSSYSSHPLLSLTLPPFSLLPLASFSFYRTWGRKNRREEGSQLDQ